MKKYFTPEAEIYKYKLEEAVLNGSTGTTGEYTDDEMTSDGSDDPFGS